MPQVNELLNKVEDPDARAALEKIINDQNKYIGALESQRSQNAPQQAQPQQAPQTNAQSAYPQYFENYIRESMRKDYMQGASVQLIATFGKDVYDCLNKELEEFITANMSPEKASVQYISDAFYLLYGRAQSSADHPIHQLGKNIIQPQPNPITIETGHNPVAQQQPAAQIPTNPPMMSAADRGVPTQPIVNGQQQPTNTKDAKAKFLARMGNINQL